MIINLFVLIAVFYVTWVVYPHTLMEKFSVEDLEAFRAFINKPEYRYIAFLLTGFTFSIFCLVVFILDSMKDFFSWQDSRDHLEGEYIVTLNGKEKWLL